MSIENQLGAVSHEDWMRRALSVASKGMREDEVPIGAIVV
jgi:tRNA(adenine34) deaminase